MDGDSPDLPALRALCDAADAFLIVDEAHAFGTFGPEGRGLCALAGVRPDVWIGTFGKAIGVHGAFVAGSERLRDFLWNRARSFVFSTATSPALARTVLERLETVVAADSLRERLRDHCASFAAATTRLRVPTPAGRHGPIFPILMPSAEAARTAAARLADAGIIAPPVLPPTVPAGSSRLRLTLSAAFSSDDVSRATSALECLIP
jgi:8-amino-7-oxononanoate synthase